MIVNNSTHDLPLSEFLRPTTIADLMIADRDVVRLQKMIDMKNVANMIFYGPPGLGKTSAARILINDTDAECLVIDRSSCRSVGNLERYINGFASSGSLFERKKIVLIDDAEYIGKRDQHSLRVVIEEYYQQCRFIITTNKLSLVDRAVQSRMVALDFDVPSTMTKSVITRLAGRFGKKLSDLGYDYDPKKLTEIVAFYFPDFRQTVNRIEFEFG